MESKKRGRPLGVRNGQIKTGTFIRPNILRSRDCTKRYRSILPRQNYLTSVDKSVVQSEEGGFLVDCDVLSGTCHICMKRGKVLNLRASQENEEFAKTVNNIIGKRVSSSSDWLLCFSCFQNIKSAIKAQETLEVHNQQIQNDFAFGETVKSVEFWSGRKTSFEILNKTNNDENTVTVMGIKLNNLDIIDCDINLKFIQVDNTDEQVAPDLCKILLKCSRLNIELDLAKEFCQIFNMSSSTILATEVDIIAKKVTFGVNGLVKLSFHKTDFHFECEECKEGFSNIYDCIIHVNIHEFQQWISINGDGVQCKFCGGCFKTESLLNDHIEFYHPITKHKCEYCGDEFDNKSKIKSHINNHIIYICSYCNETFVNEELLNLHMEEKHVFTINEATLIENSNCSELLNASDIIEIKTLDGWVCQVCKKLFRRKSNYNEHLQRHLGIGDKPCPYCEQLFFASSLRKHIASKHAENESRDSPDKKGLKTASSKRCLLLCDVCSLTFKSSGDLIGHKKSVHLDILCDSNSQFGVSQMLEDRTLSVDSQATHTKELSIIPEPNKSETNQYHEKCEFNHSLTSNKASRILNLKPEEIINFPLPTIIKIMEKTLYHCPLCSKIFEHLKSYKLHIQSKHLKPFLCHICKECTFPTSVQLTAHQENCKFVRNIETANQAPQY